MKFRIIKNIYLWRGKVSMIGIMEPPIFAVMEPVKRVEKGSSDPPFNQAI